MGYYIDLEKITGSDAGLAEATGTNPEELLKLAHLADLSRIKWVGATYAQMLYDLGVDSAKKVSEADPTDLHTRINRLIKENNIFKGQIGVGDIRVLIEAAAELPVEIEY